MIVVKQPPQSLPHSVAAVLPAANFLELSTTAPQVIVAQSAVTESANVPALQAAHEPAAVEEAPLNREA